MYKYKRGISKIQNLKTSSFLISNNDDVITSLTYNFGAYRPYNGIYIKNNKVLVENLVEEIEAKNEIYKIANLKTANIDICCDEYIEKIDLDNNEITYKLGDIEYSKNIILDIKSDNIIIKYKINNNKHSNIKFRVSPLITDRGFTEVKTAQMLKFTQRKTINGVVINLSIMDNRNLYIKSDDLVYDKDVEYINNVKHSTINKNKEEKIYVEDVFRPGIFETTVKKQTSKEFFIVISTKNIDLSNIDVSRIQNEYNEHKNNIISNIPEEYQELRDLALGIDGINIKKDICDYPFDIDLCSIYTKDETTLERLLSYINLVIEYTKAIDGRFIVLQKNKEAKEKINKVEKIIKDLSSLNIQYDSYIIKLYKLKLWYIEILNKVIDQYTEDEIKEKLLYVKQIIYKIYDEKLQRIVLNSIETASLMFNDIKIYIHNASKYLRIDDDELYNMELSIKNLIEKKFWDESTKCLKENLDDEIPRSNVSMLYALSLSYPCLVGEKSIKLLDTIFKELYTPYGLRLKSKNSKEYNGMIYPEYLAHFIKANLRQNGVTRASKKIAYNLVKEIIIDINNNISGGVPHVYNEKGLIIDDNQYNLLTNSEIIRLYDMLT